MFTHDKFFISINSMVESILKRKKKVHFSAMEKYVIWNGDIFHSGNFREHFHNYFKGLLHNFSLCISLRI